MMLDPSSSLISRTPSGPCSRASAVIGDAREASRFRFELGGVLPDLPTRWACETALLSRLAVGCRLVACQLKAPLQRPNRECQLLQRDSDPHQDLERLFDVRRALRTEMLDGFRAVLEPLVESMDALF